MSGFWHLNVIHFLDFYFSFFFLANTLRRFGQFGRTQASPTD
jgi:hypothetical protein